MLSIGIRFGQGFDRFNVLRVMQTVPKDYEYDLIILGSDPGGIALAREACAAGKKTALIKWKTYSPAEQEGFDENLEELERAVEVPQGKTPSTLHDVDVAVSSDPALLHFHSKYPKLKKSKSASKTMSKFFTFGKDGNDVEKQSKRDRKVRKSRLDLSNALFRRGQQCRKIMINAVMHKELLDEARNCGWRVPAVLSPMTMNWNKMMDQVMDFVMKENWKLATLLSEESIELIEGFPTFIDSHRIRVTKKDSGEFEISANIICAAPVYEWIFPKTIRGAAEYGITCDDFVRLVKPPGKTLIVGSRPEGLECAGIVACSGLPVTVVCMKKVLKEFDIEIAKLITNDLKSRGVKFREETILQEIEMTPSGRLLAKFSRVEQSKTSIKLKFSKISNEFYGEEEDVLEDEYDTVVFAVGTTVTKNYFLLKGIGVELDSKNRTIKTRDNDATSVPHIFALGPIVAYHPQNQEISELAGKLLGRRLYFGSQELMDYAMNPFIIYTPIPYAYLGVTEEGALFRLGPICVDIYTAYFRPVEYLLPSKTNPCFAKIVVYKPKDLVIGLHILGPEAGEIMQGFAIAVKQGLTMSQLRNFPGVHGTKAKELLKLNKDKKPDEVTF